jgi:putative Holliday junction resolvase
VSEDILLGIDYGDKNTGLAFGRAGVVSPLTVLDSRDEGNLLAQIGRFVVENKITKIIMGLPLTLDGKETQQSIKVRKFTKILKIKLKKPVEFVSEFGTTKESIQRAIRSGISQKRRQTNDHLSAALILKRHYSELE